MSPPSRAAGSEGPGPLPADRGLPFPRLSEFEEFFRAEFGGAVRYVTSKVGVDRSTAEDAAQNAFVKIAKSWPHAIDLKKPSAYLRRIAYNEALSITRKSARHVPVSDTSLHFDRLMISMDEIDEVELQQSLRNLLKLLPPRQSSVVALAHDGKTTADIAVVLDISEATVRSHLRHAREKLAEMWRDDSSGSWSVGGRSEIPCR
ncbi:RNA polymerase sigma factor [Actinomadura graeca]|uniref:RNA polymerase sigma factor n=1 Tax=Actinomadura graeca TaxID=2750812 RepID=A0ABX8QYZ8_9ACTN|nr:RNA polymerase sigma factor [Actinomadura graeca]QXJ21998.1 RNA polymerase sigma factor [Actinomadura graeca]